jgi:hypothetical protein
MKISHFGTSTKPVKLLMETQVKLQVCDLTQIAPFYRSVGNEAVYVMGCETWRLKQLPDHRLTDGGDVGSLTLRPVVF